ncbi:ribonuclease regulator [Vibrio maerlii]|uniref:ribonuclease regulator n=1 Tax=Vibrio maerlii TaxID=2231648 RepID=UPI000E3E7FBC|nr:ribonuclease regulator [Vibrio maerlii]
MTRAWFLLSWLFASVCYASDLPTLPSHKETSPHKLFISSEQNSNQSFDTWTIDSGYAYSILDDVDIYIGARVNNGNEIRENGFLSGVSYQFNDKIVFKSTLHAKDRPEDDVVSGNAKFKDSVTAEVSSRVKLSENIDIHATLDYEQFEQGIEFGLGFRF